ncbi:MAG: lamin tail domain-containing protein [Crocinitomicaceae bacterium]|nr:lamin tail domain-containing protein [Crocinitomicaceae bacterium]
MKKLLFVFALFLSSVTYGQIKFTTVDPYSKGITIKNFGSSNTNISTYRLNSLLESQTLNQTGVTIISGDFDLSPGESVSVKWNSATGFNMVSSDLCLYLPTGDLDDFTNIVAFMEYNAGGQGRENIAVNAGLWVVNTFVTGSGPFYYSGDGIQSGYEYWGVEMPGIGSIPAVVINEIDADQVGVDTLEFVELFGTPLASLDGLILVFFNGSAVNNGSYKAIPLSSTLDLNGFFVVGNPSVSGVNITFPNDILQNGADAVAIYQGTIASWPFGTPPTNNNLIDAVVYGTSDADDVDLLAALTPGQIQANESSSNVNSISKLPDGGAPFETSLFVAQPPTPGETNVIPLECDGGEIALENSETSLSLCSEDPLLPVTFLNSSTTLVPYIYVITNSGNQIISINYDGIIDFTSFAEGEMHIWGVSYTGTLTASTILAGQPVASITSDDCYSISGNFITVTKAPCQVVCDGGQVTTSNAENNIILCSEDPGLAVSFTNNSSSSGTYVYIAANSSNQIFSVDADGTIDFTDFADGEIHLWGLSYTGTLNGSTIVPGSPVASIVSDGCYSLSSNFVTVTKSPCGSNVCDGATVLSNDGSTLLTFCIDGNDDVVAFSNTSEEGVSYSYIVSNNGIITTVTDQPVNFDLFPAGTYSVKGISHTGALNASTIEPGDNVASIATVSGCMEFSSNQITVVTTECTVVEGCTELFFSEYLEGLSNNKALEIYNPTNFTVDLSHYSIKSYMNGSATFTYALPLSGMLAAGETFLIVNSSADQTLLSLADQTGGQVATFNGNDAIQLLHDGVVIDVIGIAGIDPGNNIGWAVGSGTTYNHDLVRKSSVTSPTTNWTYSTGQWEVYSPNDFSHAGSHIAATCSDIPQIGFTATVIEVEEDAGTVTISVQAYNIPAPIDITVDVTSNSAIPDEDYTNIFPVTLSFAAGTSIQTISIPIIDDDIEEEDEFLWLTLGSATTVNWVQQEINIIINHNDQGYPLYTISQISGTNPAGVLDSLGVYCELRGIVHGINFNASGLHFHLIDPTDGIKVFLPTGNLGYTVNEGDSIAVLGEIFQFYGQAEIRPDGIQVLGSGNLHIPDVVSILSEINESHLVTLRCVSLSDVGEWDHSGNGFYVHVTDGTNVNMVRIDADASDLFSMNAPQGHFTITGIVEQEDETSPYNSGYSLWLRSVNDITENVFASFTTYNPLLYGDNGASVTFNNESSGAVSYHWSFGDGEASDDTSPSHEYEYDWLVLNEDFIITLIATNGANCSDELSISIDAVYTGIEEVNAIMNLYPNPASEILHIVSDSKVRDYYLIDQTGKVVLSELGVNEFQTTADLSTIASGIYTMKIRIDNGTIFKRIIRN